jgi:hypothetical protein
MTPKQTVGIELRIRQFFPAVPALLHDSHVAAEARKIIKEAEQILPWHKRLLSFTLALILRPDP